MLGPVSGGWTHVWVNIRPIQCLEVNRTYTHTHSDTNKHTRRHKQTDCHFTGFHFTFIHDLEKNILFSKIRNLCISTLFDYKYIINFFSKLAPFLFHLTLSPPPQLTLSMGTPVYPAQVKLCVEQLYISTPCIFFSFLLNLYFHYFSSLYY